MLASAINDKDGGDDSDQKPSGQPVRMSARQALEVLAAARWRLYYEEGPPPGRKDVPDEREEESRRAPPNRQDKANDDPVFGDISVIQEALMKGLADPNVEARIAAIIALENLRDAAVRATPGLVKELGNSDVFVRWSAARALGKIEESRRRAKVPRAAAAKGAVDGLIRLLSDTDLDVQLAAAVALEPWGGDAAKAAGPLATAAATGDPSFRLAAIHALGEIGEPGHTKNAAAQLAKAVAFPEDDRVRAEAARLLGQFGPAAQDSIGALRAALKDPDASVRRAASDALLSITAPRPK